MYHVFLYLLHAISYKGLHDALIIMVIKALKFQDSVPGKGVKCYHNDTRTGYKEHHVLYPTPTLYGMIMTSPSKLEMKLRIYVRTSTPPHTIMALYPLKWLQLFRQNSAHPIKAGSNTDIKKQTVTYISTRHVLPQFCGRYCYSNTTITSESHVSLYTSGQKVISSASE
jgi:hypothetical protein